MVQVMHKIKSAKRATPEGRIEEDCLKYLNQHGFYAFKVKSSGTFDQRSGQFRKASVYEVNGISDILAIRSGVTFYIEVKTGTGYQSKDQLNFQRQVERFDGVYVLVRSVEELEEYVRDWFK